MTFTLPRCGRQPLAVCQFEKSIDPLAATRPMVNVDCRFRTMRRLRRPVGRNEGGGRADLGRCVAATGRQDRGRPVRRPHAGRRRARRLRSHPCWSAPVHDHGVPARTGPPGPGSPRRVALADRLRVPTVLSSAPARPAVRTTGRSVQACGRSCERHRRPSQLRHCSGLLIPFGRQHRPIVPLTSRSIVDMSATGCRIGGRPARRRSYRSRPCAAVAGRRVAVTCGCSAGRDGRAAGRS